MSEEKKEEQNQGNKVEKKFDANIIKLVSLFNGGPLLKAKSKVPNDTMSELIEELTKESREAITKEFKEKAKALLSNKVTFDKFVEQQKRDMEKAILDKKKEFSKQMDDLFALVENIDQISKDYQESLAN